MDEDSLVEPLILYDGVCGLCHRSVRFLLKVDAHQRLTFAPLQGDTAARARLRYPQIPAGLDSVVLIDDGRVHLRSRVFTVGARHLPYPWRLAYLGRFFPAFIADILYRFVARIRYRVWGKHDVCAIPSPEERARFLE